MKVRRRARPCRWSARVARVARLAGLGTQAPNAPLVFARLEVHVLPHVAGHVVGMLDYFAIHIGDVDRAVRTVGNGDRAKPVVAAAERFGTFVDAPRGERAADFFQPVAAHQSARRVG